MIRAIILIIINFSLLFGQTKDQIKQQIKNLDLTVEQAKQIAKDQGYSNEQIELEAVTRGVDLDIENKSEQSELNVSNLFDDLDEINNENIERTNNQDEDEIQFFGYQIFQGDPAAFQASTFGVVDPNYNIGPGDQIILMLWGESQFRQEFIIDTEGYVFIPEIGQVFVNGLNLETLEKKIFQILSKVYSTLNPKNKQPTTFMDISLGNLRPLRIIVLGEVSQPGAFLVSPSASLSSSLYYFNGPTTFGSLREINLLRKGKNIGNIDFYDYLLSGNVPNDIRLQADDIIFIPPRGKTVTIKGEINRQGVYELKDNEGMFKLIKIAGDLTTYAYTHRAQISRILPNEDRVEMGMDRMIIDINLEDIIINKNDEKIYDGDIIEIFPIKENYSNYVSIRSSSIMRSGRYQLVDGMTVLDLINSSDGLLNDAYLLKAHIRRVRKDLTTELITINLNKVLKGDLDENIELKFMDELIVYNANELKNSFTNVHILGPVKNPGYYSFDKDIKLGDLIIRSGGFISSVNRVKILIARTNNDNFVPKVYSFPNNSQYIDINDLSNDYNEINNFTIFPNDIITIYDDPRGKVSETVKISGAIYHPGHYPILSTQEKVSDIISRSGGLLPSSYPKASLFKRGDNFIKLSFDKIIKNKKSIENFNIMPGDEIIILTKSNTVKINGEVNQPGIYKFYKGYNVSKYIKIAGGLTVNAQKKEIWVSHPDGTSQKWRKYLPPPQVFDSSIITIGTKPESDPVDRTELAKEVASIISDFLQIALTITILNKN